MLQLKSPQIEKKLEAIQNISLRNRIRIPMVPTSETPSS